jgi:hypothetical protein
MMMGIILKASPPHNHRRHPEVRALARLEGWIWLAAILRDAA